MILEKEDVGKTLDASYFINLAQKNWIVITVCIVFALAIAHIVNKYSIPKYEVRTAVLINEETGKGSAISASILGEMGLSGKSVNFTNELNIINTPPIINEAIQDLNFEVSYFQHYYFTTKELYKSCPFVVILDRDHPQITECPIRITIGENGKFSIYIDKENVSVYNYSLDKKIKNLPSYTFEKDNISFGTEVQNENIKIKILMNNSLDLKELNNNVYSFILHDRYSLRKKYERRIKVSPTDVESTIADISIQTKVPDKGIDFLNALAKAYLNQDVYQTKSSFSKTVEYIDQQLEEVESSLANVESNLQDFRSDQEIVNLSFQAEQIYNEMKDLKKEKAQLLVNEKYVDYILEYFDKNQLYSDLITPSAMGIVDATLNNLVEELIRLNTEKASFIDNNQTESPYLNKINVRIDNLRNLILENIKYIKKTSNIAIDDLDSRIDQLNNEIKKMPQTQRELTGIERMFSINDAIYTYLLEKKSEAEIAEASYQPDSKIIRSAEVIGLIWPKGTQNYILAVAIGFLIPFLIFHFINVAKTSISNENEVKEISGFSVLGRINNHNYKEENVVAEFPSSEIAESFRHLRINLNYFISGDNSKTIVVSSTISEEGKSFVSLNLALALASSNEKVVLLGFDLRRPRSYVPYVINESVGITEYLSNQATLDDIISNTPNNNLDIITAGKRPPNPGELISSTQTKELIETLKESYTYVIIDTSPIGLVSDAFSLYDSADLKIIVTRINRTPKKEFKELVTDLKTKTIAPTIIVNGVNDTVKSRYGYYTESHKTNKWSRFLKWG